MAKGWVGVGVRLVGVWSRGVWLPWELLQKMLLGDYTVNSSLLGSDTPGPRQSGGDAAAQMGPELPMAESGAKGNVHSGLPQGK